MKKITFIVFMFLMSWCGYSQLDLETFESNGNALPAGWQQINVAGPSQAWTVATHSVITPSYGGTGHAAYIQKENVATGTTEDWLVTKPFTVPANGELHFQSRLTQLGDDGNTYRIMINVGGTNAGTTANYTQVQAWTELTLNPDPFQTDYLEKIVTLPASSVGQTVTLAFVMNGDNGDRWLVDNVVVASQCLSPTGLPTTNVGTNTATLNWTNPSGATQWTIDIVGALSAPTGAGIAYTGPPSSYVATTDSAGNPLQPATQYKYYVRATCTGGITSAWAGPFNFATVVPGATCTSPLVITTDTYTQSSNTNLFGDDIEGTVGSTGCGTTANYLNGDEVVYAYTPTYTGTANFSMTNNGINSGMFIYNNCADIGVGCAAGGGIGATPAPVTINLAVTAGQTYYVVISTSGTTQSTPYTLTIQRVNCAPPVGLPTTGIDGDSANLSWTNPGGASSWQVVVQAPGTGIPAGAGTDVSTNTNYQAGPLAEGTNYEYYVRAACGDGTFSAWAGPYLFTTTQIPAPIPYVQDFEGTSGFATSNGTQTNKWFIGTAVSNSPTHSLYISDTNGTTHHYNTSNASVVHAYRDLAIPSPVDQLQLQFDWRNQGESNFDFIRVWLVPASFTPTPGTQITAAAGRIQLGANFQLNNNWTTDTRIINATPYAGTVMRLVFEWTSDTSAGTQQPGAIDNINISVVPCPSPTNVALGTPLTNNSAIVNWTGPTSVSPTFDYVFGTTNTAPVAGTVPTGNVATPTVPFTSLTPSTTYYFWVRSNCGGGITSAWVGPLSFTTPQIPATLNYAMDFEDPNYQWTLSNGTQTNKWFYGTAVSNSPTHSLYISDTNGTTHHYNTSNASVVHAYRDIALPTPLDQVLLQYDWRNQGESNFDFIRVWVVPVTFTPTPGTQITVANSGGIQLGGNHQLNNNWTTENRIINAAAYAGTTVRLVFEWTSDTSAGTQQPGAIDNVNISIITCPSPTNLALGPLTENTATVTWTGPTSVSPTFDYYYSTTNTAPTAGTVPTGNVTPAGVDLLGLTPSTQYYFWVRSNCGSTDGNSIWVGPLSFTTPQIPATLNYSQDFEDPNHQWTLANGTQTNKWVYGTAVSNSPTHSIYISNTNGTTHNYVINTTSVVHAYRDVIVPAEVGMINVSFDWRNQGENNFDYIRVWVVPISFVPTPGTQITAANSGGVQLGGNHQGSNTWTTSNYNLPTPGPAAIRRIIFEWRNDGSGGTQQPGAVDNININIITCPPPFDLNVNCVSSTSANIEWEPGSDETEWEYALLPTSAPAPTSGTTIDTTSYIAEGLDTNTNYTFYVRALCSDPNELSSWAQGSFTTTDVSIVDAEPFCGTTNSSIIFDNTFGQGFDSGYGEVACLGSTPNPVWYYLQVDETGQLDFRLVQNTQFDNNGNAIGTGLDVDFAAFGPFTSLTQACAQIDLVDCPTCPFSNVGSNFYPFGNIIDCSYSTAAIETFTVPNAQEGEIYAVLITNFDGDQGQIQLQQLDSSTGTTDCDILYNVALGPDKILCGQPNTTITASVTTPGNGQGPSYQWFMDGSTTPFTPTIVSTTSLTQTILITEPGYHTYTVVVTVPNAANTEPITDDVIVALGPEINLTDVAVTYCGNGGSTSVDLTTLNDDVLGTLAPAEYDVTYYPTSADATNGVGAIDVSTPFVTSSTVIYARVNNIEVDTCFDVVAITITVNATPTATISYANSPYCTNSGTAAVTNTGDTSGTYSSTAGLTIDAATGDITLVSSTPGTYTVTYTIAATSLCPEFTTTTQVVVEAAPEATIAYASSPYCTSGTAATVTQTGAAGGTYTSTAGLDIDPVTGEIDLQGSTAGTYTVTYTVPATTACAELAVTTEVTINVLASATISYGTVPYCTNGGTATVTQTGDTGGTYSSDAALSIDAVTGEITLASSTPGTYTVTYTIAATTSCPEFTTTAQVVVEAAPEATIAYAATPYCSNGGTATVTQTGSTGGTYTSDPGLVINAATGDIDLAASTVGTYTVTYTVAATAACGPLSVTTSVVINALPVATIAYNASPYCADAGTASVTFTGDAGGTYTGDAGISVDAATGDINLAASSPGTHTVTYTIAAGNGCSEVTATATVVITALPSASFTYEVAAVCQNAGGTQSPTFNTGAIAGTFTTDVAGLTINSATGVITPGTSTEGTYIVTNTIAAANGCGVVTNSVTIVINPAPIATFAYGALAYCQDTANPSPILDGGAGTFTSTTGLVINSSTGTIDLAGSTPGTYTVTNTIPGTTECPAVSATATVTVTSIPVVAVLQGCEGGSFMLEVTFDNDEVYTADTVDFVWTDGAGTQIGTESKIRVTEPDTYHLTVIPRNNNECALDTDVVVDDTACDVPRGISPNNDGKNDSFDLTALDVRKISIFNRYGQEVYTRGNGYTNQWIGQTSGGDELPTGTYFYMIERTNGESKTGWVYINRQIN